MTTEQSIDSLLQRWDDLREQGRELSAEELSGNRLDLLPELKLQIERLKAMDWLDHPDEHSCCGNEQISNALPDYGPGQAEVPSTLAGRYELESLIAQGGFGQVWRAFDTVLQRPIAVKVTTIDCHTEARRVAQLQHQGIVAVHDAGNENGLCYIVFDLVEGPTLADKIRDGDLTWRQSAQIIADVATSLQFAHDKGFIHRDIKPANILINAEGKPVLADFGIAVTECELKHEAVTSLGTLAYMAPEQLIPGGQLDARTDIYGLGVVLYELLTGQLPFSSPTISGLREAILNSQPTSPRMFRPQISEQCEQVCLKCLSRDKVDRFPTATDLAKALIKAIHDSDS